MILLGINELMGELPMFSFFLFHQLLSSVVSSKYSCFYCTLLTSSLVTQQSNWCRAIQSAVDRRSFERQTGFRFLKEVLNWLYLSTEFAQQWLPRLLSHSTLMHVNLYVHSMYSESAAARLAAFKRVSQIYDVYFKWLWLINIRLHTAKVFKSLNGRLLTDTSTFSVFRFITRRLNCIFRAE